MLIETIQKRQQLLRIALLAAVIGFCISLLYIQAHAVASTKGIQVTIKDSSGREIDLYSGSHALIVGVSNYTAGWPKLESVPGEIMGVEQVLAKSGFTIQRVLDPDSIALKTAFTSFINRFGYNPHNRLLFFFSGHGYSRKNPVMGYLVPTDAPDPREDHQGFLRKAVSMSQITTWCREMEAKHALFVFDSCFSGTIFKTRALAQYPPHISDIVAKPVRQFITAGSAGEEVPAKSVFTPSFIRALKGEGDIDNDGYVTGTELGMYLHKQVLSYDTGQSPQYGKIKDPDYDEGDFVFKLTQATPTNKQPQKPQLSPSPPPITQKTLKPWDRGFLVKKSYGIQSAKELDGAKLCLTSDRKDQEFAINYFKQSGMKIGGLYQHGGGGSAGDLLFEGRCDCIGSTIRKLKKFKASATNPEDYIIIHISPSPVSSEQISSSHQLDQVPSTKEQNAFIGKTYNVDFADSKMGNYFSARFDFPSVNSMRWQYYRDNSPKGEWYSLGLRNSSGHTFVYYGKRSEKNSPVDWNLQEDNVGISFSDNFTSFKGKVEFTWHRKSGKIDKRYYTIKGQATNR